MKVFISNQNKTLEGFVNINISNLKLDLQSIANNSCTMIIAEDIFDHHKYDEVKDLTQLLYSKLRMTGTLYISGVDASILSRYIINGSINLPQASDVIVNIKSVHSINEITELFSKYTDLELQTNIKGIKYEFRATRK